VSSINIKFPLKRSSQGAFATNDTTIDAVSDDLRILLLSNYGERPIHYDFGANLRSLAFEQGSGLIGKAENLIVTAIEKWMPFVQLTDLIVEDESTNVTLKPNEISIHLEFKVGELIGKLRQSVRN